MAASFPLGILEEAIADRDTDLLNARSVYSDSFKWGLEVGEVYYVSELQSQTPESILAITNELLKELEE